MSAPELQESRAVDISNFEMVLEAALRSAGKDLETS